MDKNENEDETSESSSKAENSHLPKFSKVSLKVKSERTNLQKSSLTLTGIFHLGNDLNQINSREVDVNYPSTSHDINAEITVLYKNSRTSDEQRKIRTINFATREKLVSKINPDEEIQTIDQTPNPNADKITESENVGTPKQIPSTLVERNEMILPGSSNQQQHVNNQISASYQIPTTKGIIFEPSEFQISITPPLYPPTVLYCAPPIHGAPPSYSAAIMAIGCSRSTISNRRRSIFRVLSRRQEIRIQPSPPFIAPPPPPSYAETQGLSVYDERPRILPTIDIDETIIWSMDPMSVVCPQCNNFVITTVHTRRSNITHFSAMALCLCGCWPCCLLPYCLKSCKTTYHECPVCLSVIGMYNPW